MLQFILEQNILLYALTLSCVLGVASQLILNRLYDRLLKDTQNTGEPKGKFMKQLRLRFQNCTHLNERVNDVDAFVERSMMEYECMGLNLHQWRRFGMGALAVCVAVAAAGIGTLIRDGGDFYSWQQYLWAGVGAVLLTGIVYALTDTGYKRRYLKVRLKDYLVNSGVLKDYRVSSLDELTAEQGRAELAASFPPAKTTRKERRARVRQAKREAAAAVMAAPAETKAQKEKRELKENLMKIKSGMAESAAGREDTKERNADVLRQMDPGEQERILREVLKEFLT